MDLAKAFDRLDSFCAVQSAQHGGFTLEAVACLHDAVGLGDTERRLISEHPHRVDDRLPSVRFCATGTTLPT